MTSRPASPRVLARALAAAAATLALAAPAAADTPERGDFDARPAGGDEPAPRIAAGQETLRESLGALGVVTTEERTGTPRAVADLDGFLTRPSPRDAARIALDYVRDHPEVFGLDGGDVAGLRLVDRTFSGGVEHLRWEQRYRGIPSSDTQLDAAVTGAGRLVGVTGPAAPDLAVPSIEPAVSADAAYAAVRRSGRAERAAVAVRTRAGGPEQRTEFADGGTASLVLYQAGDGAQLAWRVLAPVSSTEVYDATVDAATGAVVRRANRVSFADALVYPTDPRAPAETKQLDPWLEPLANRLKGPRVHAFVDAQDHVHAGQVTVPDGAEVRPLAGPHWTFPLLGFASARCAPSDCTWNPAQPGAWDVNREQSATQLFYLVNTFLDHLASDPILFGDDDGSFGGDDPVLAQAMDGASGPAGNPDAEHVNNAGFLALPDGTPGQLLSFLFSRGPDADPTPFGDFDAANDASVIYHEVAHGLSERLVIDAQGFGALTSAQAGAIGEGTSDFYAMDFLLGADDDADADVEHRVGSYLDDADPRGLRYQAIDCDVDSGGDLCQEAIGTGDDGGFTYADFGKVHGMPEVHSDGEIWAQTLWDLRQALGPEAARRVITGGLRLSPPEPSFLDMRNAILASSADADEKADIWDVFAARGMGYFASTDGGADVDPVADYEVEPTGEGAELSGHVRDEDGAPVAGARVGVAGHDTRYRGGAPGPTLAEETDGNGFYRLHPPAGDYPLVVARKAGYREDRSPLSLPQSGGLLDFELDRDFSSGVAGASVERFDKPDNTSSGCGPGGLIDDEPGTVWGTDTVPGGKRIVIDLGKPIQLAGVAIDPGAGCGDDPTAALREYALGGALTPDAGFAPLAAGAFAGNQGGELTDVPVPGGRVVRFLELHAITPQSSAPGGSGAQYLDVAELHVAKVPNTTPGPSVETGAVLAASTKTARLAGTVVPRGTVGTLFEYGPVGGATAEIPARSVTGGTSAETVTRDLSGLLPGTDYRYRFVAIRDGVRYPGAQGTFTTAPAVVVPTPTPTPTPTATPTPRPPDPTVTATAIVSKRLRANRAGRFKVRWTFGDAAPAGKARVSVTGKRRKRIATARVTVQRGRTITKTLRLNRAGRKMIRRGRSLRVTLELRLPGGGTLRERVRLSRKR